MTRKEWETTALLFITAAVVIAMVAGLPVIAWGTAVCTAITALSLASER